MKSPPIPADEGLRLQALREYRILDTPAELDFDEVVLLAAQVCGTSMAAMSLVDSDRQWFKSRHHLEARETPREHAFCAHGICAPEPLLIVPDTALDERFHDNPLVTGEPRLRFYAGAKLVTPAGHVIGMLCVLERVPRQLDPEQRSALLTLTRQIMAQLELRRLLAAQQDEIAARRAAEVALCRRNAILEVIGFAAETLLAMDDFNAAVGAVLEHLGQATESDHLGVWQLHPTGGDRGVLKLLHVWGRPVARQSPGGGGRPTAIPLGPASVFSLQEMLDNKTPIEIRPGSGSPAQRRLLEEIGVKSLLCIPLFTFKEKLWGMLSSGWVRAEMQWSLPGIETLCSASRVLSSLTNSRVSDDARRISEERFRALSASAPIGIFETDAAVMRNLYTNPRMRAIMGLEAHEFESRRWLRAVHPEDRQKVLAAWRRANRDAASIVVEHRIRSPSQEIRWVKVLASPVRGADGKVVSFVGTVDDVTESHRTTEALRQSENNYRSLVTNLKEVVFRTDADGRWTFLNPAWEEITGHSVAESLGTPFLNCVHPDDREHCRELFGASIRREREFSRHEVRYLTKQGGFRWTEVFARLALDDQGRITGVTGTLNDITTRKEAEERIEASLREKEVLLKEVNHRVKNNLQVISSLLNLQREHIREEKARELFADAQGRIAAMALVHEKLYRSNDLGRVDFADYLRDLTDNLVGLMGSRVRNVSLQLESAGLHLGLDTAIPCGLVINELVTNAYKHAFPSGGPGRVAVTFTRADDGRLRLVVSDDGCGLPPELDLRQAESLGLRLVQTLVQQLHGTLDVERGPGTRFVLQLEEVRRRERPAP